MAPPWYFLEDPLDDAGADAEFLADLEDAITFGPQFYDLGFDRRLNPSPTQLCAVCSCAREPCINSLPNDAPLELGEHSEHLKHRFAGGSRRVETLLMEEQANTFFVEALEYIEQVSE